MSFSVSKVWGAPYCISFIIWLLLDIYVHGLLLLMFATKYQTARPPHVLTHATLLMCSAFMNLSVQHFLLRSIHYFMAVRMFKTLTARWCFTLRCYRGERKNHICGTEFKILWGFFFFVLQGEFCQDTCTQTSTLSQFHLCVFDGHSPQDKNIWRNKKHIPKHFLRHL